MARSLNKVQVIGHVGADAQARYTESGNAITSFRVACSESWKDKNTGQLQERTEWVRVKCFGRTAEFAAEYIKKGRQVYVEGQLRTEKYTDKEGAEKFSTEVFAREVMLLGSGGAHGDNSGERSGSAANAQRTPSGRQAPAAPMAVGAYDDDPLGDVPF